MTCTAKHAAYMKMTFRSPEPLLSRLRRTYFVTMEKCLRADDTLVHELAHAVEFAMPDELMERVRFCLQTGNGGGTLAGCLRGE